MASTRLANVHPGEVLKEEFMTPLELTGYALAKATGVFEMAISEICRGKRSITAETALRFGTYFGVTAEFWLNLQDSFDLAETRDRIGSELKAIRPMDPRPTV